MRAVNEGEAGLLPCAFLTPLTAADFWQRSSHDEDRFDSSGCSGMHIIVEPAVIFAPHRMGLNAYFASSVVGYWGTGNVPYERHWPLHFGSCINNSLRFYRMGLNAYFASSVVGYRGTGNVPYEEALAGIFVEGWLFVLLAVTGVRAAIIKLVPRC